MDNFEIISSPTTVEAIISTPSTSSRDANEPPDHIIEEMEASIYKLDNVYVFSIDVI